MSSCPDHQSSGPDEEDDPQGEQTERDDIEDLLRREGSIPFGVVGQSVQYLRAVAHGDEAEVEQCGPDEADDEGDEDQLSASWSSVIWAVRRCMLSTWISDSASRLAARERWRLASSFLRFSSRSS